MVGLKDKTRKLLSIPLLVVPQHYDAKIILLEGNKADGYFQKHTTNL